MNDRQSENYNGFRPKSQHKIIRSLIAALLLFLPLVSQAQKLGQARIDSVLMVLSKAKLDTGKLNTLHSLFVAYTNNDETQLMPLADQMISLAGKLKWQKGMSLAYNDKGDALAFTVKDYPGAMAMYQKAYAIAKQIRNGDAINNCVYRIAIGFWNEGKIDDGFTFFNHELTTKGPVNTTGYDWYGLGIMNAFKATDGIESLKYFKKASDEFNKIGNQRMVAVLTESVGTVYFRKSDFKTALGYFDKALTAFEKLKYTARIGHVCFNIGTSYVQLNKAGVALEYYMKSLRFLNVVNDHASIAAVLNNLILIYDGQKDYNSALLYELQLLKLMHDDATEKQVATYYGNIGDQEYLEGNYSDALNNFFKAMKIFEKFKDKANIAGYTGGIGKVYEFQGNYEKALSLFKTAFNLYTELQNKGGIASEKINIGNLYHDQHQSVKARAEYEGALKFYEEVKDTTNTAVADEDLAVNYSDENNNELALTYFRKAFKLYTAVGDTFHMAHAEGNIGTTLGLIGADSTVSAEKRQEALQLAISTLIKSIAECKKMGMLDMVSLQTHALSDAYEANKQYDKALTSHKDYLIYRDSVYNQKKSDEITRHELQYDYGKREDSIKYRQTITDGLLKQQTLLASQQKQSLLINQQQLGLANKEKDLEQSNYLRTQADLEANKNKLKASQKEQALTQTTFELQKAELSSKQAQSRYFIGGIIVLVILSFFIGLNYYNQRKATQVIVLANKQTAIQKAFAEKRLQELIVTQNQLVQAEKMASLGELTAGIAHEIQNPLNFVNNFTEVNIELLDELEEEVIAEHGKDVLILAGDLRQNLKKVLHHGKRADSIVKGMLEHSRANSGQKELTDINKLVDEHLRLAYHGLRAKDKSFNAEMETHFAAGLPEILLAKQDIGRVLLNIFNNAFYAVHQKQSAGIVDYHPRIGVSTALKDGQLLIQINDNGNGIPDDIKDKIMQPFFTTKPTGEGTGLGLSLSYDIVVKGHNGKIAVDSKDGEGATFDILLPVLV